MRAGRKSSLLAAALHPHVAVLDARLPDGSGIDVCRDIRSADPSIHALILTSFEDDEALFAAIMAGASGYVPKQIYVPSLLAKLGLERRTQAAVLAVRLQDEQH